MEQSSKIDLDYDKFLREFLLNKHTLFDRDILYISCGALAITFSFVGAIIKLDHAADKYFLILSWLLFAMAILFCMIATHINITRVSRLIDMNYTGGVNEALHAYRMATNKLMRWLRLIPMILLISGIIFLLLFISINLI
ncbi:MAG TPA: hypothetical protein VE978_13450 [Chitinophagales bacterium]|nr:hypothetical protein [Chitinophagales bacterium]